MTAQEQWEACLPSVLHFNQLPFHRERAVLDESWAWTYRCEDFWAHYFYEPDEEIGPLRGFAVSISIPYSQVLSTAMEMNNIVEARIKNIMLSLHDGFVREFKRRVQEHLALQRDWRD